MVRNVVVQELTHFPFFFFNDTATTEIYTLSLHDALPISPARVRFGISTPNQNVAWDDLLATWKETEALGFDSAWVFDHFIPIFGNQDGPCLERSEEHTSELQSQSNLVCRLLLEKKKKNSK